MKKFLIPIALVVLATPARSIELGIGVELARTSQTIYLPIKVSEDARVEPYIAHTKTSRTGSAAGEDFGSVIGIGLFCIKPRGMRLMSSTAQDWVTNRLSKSTRVPSHTAAPAIFFLQH
jgi:hypothetical protein